MSILETPRIYFKGNISWDPVTTNNFSPDQNQKATYNEADCVPVLNKGVVGTRNVDAYQQASIDEVPYDKVDKLSSWNPDGTYRSVFFDTYISGVDTGSGLDRSDSFVKAPVKFKGMLVDSEPYGPFSSQLFFDDMSFGINGGCRIFGKRITRYSDRYINFTANPVNSIIAGRASVLWQTVFPKDAGLEIDDHDSVVLQNLKNAMSSDDVLGVMVRWNSYRTIYFNNINQSDGSASQQVDSLALIAKLNLGGFQPNPARSLIVGTVGVWRRGESPTEPSDRTLISTLAPIPQLKGSAVGTAFVRTTHNSITLDLSNSMPCNSRTPTKLDLGPLSIVAADPPPAVAIMDVASLDFEQYNMEAYEATSGIVTIPLEEGEGSILRNMNLSITGENGGPSYLQEVPLRAVPDTPNFYCNQGEAQSASVQIYHRGEPAGPGIKVIWSLLSAADDTHFSATTNANGRINVAVNTLQPSVYAYVFQISDNPILPVGPKFNALVFSYMYVRVLPSDTEIAQMEPSWENVHNYVLSNWEALAPCMDNWLRLGDEQQVKAYAAIIKRLTDPTAFEEFRFMPVTRDLSPGQRSLLYRFLDGEDIEEKIASSLRANSTFEHNGDSIMQIAKLAKAHRGGG